MYKRQNLPVPARLVEHIHEVGVLKDVLHLAGRDVYKRQLITVILYGRMIEIYLYCSVSPIPFATMTNREWGQIGNNYLKSLFAIGFQGFLIMICVGIYAVLVGEIDVYKRQGAGEGENVPFQEKRARPGTVIMASRAASGAFPSERGRNYTPPER